MNDCGYSERVHKVPMTHASGQNSKGLYTPGGGRFFMRLIPVSSYFFELLLLSRLLSHRMQILHCEKATYIYFLHGKKGMTRSIFLSFRSTNRGINQSRNENGGHVDCLHFLPHYITYLQYICVEDQPNNEAIRILSN